MNIVLVGFMGTGKSAVGKELAKRLGMRYLDTDKLVERKEGLSIPEIFSKKGEKYFRELEAKIVKEVSKQKGCIISTGGGVVLRKDNIEALQKEGCLVCLEAKPEIILKRIENDGEERPLLEGVSDKIKRVKTLLKKRCPFYAQADIIIDTSSLKVSEIVDKIINTLSGKRLQVKLGKRSYPVFVGYPLEKVGKIAKDFSLGKKILIISDRKVFPLYGEKVKNSLKEEGFSISSLEIPPGEKSKTLSKVKKIYNFCLEKKLDRLSSILALGGGVVGDMAGFAAATFLRGINFLMVPTTLLSQVDSAVGGKVGVNLPQGKNLVGAFYQPRFVLIDPLVLRTLSPKRIREGMAEVIKCAIIKNDGFFSYLENNLQKVFNKDFETLKFVIEKAVKTKIDIVEEDEREERGIRQILNFGHTIAHAIEATAKYGRYTHGEAVAVGMIGEAKIGYKMGCFSLESLRRVEELLNRANLPTKARGLDPEKILEKIALDKKVKEGKVWFVLPKRIGEVFLTSSVSLKLVKEVLRELVE